MKNLLVELVFYSYLVDFGE